VVDAAGVVDGVDEPTCDELRVEFDSRRATPLPLVLWPLGWSTEYWLLSLPRLLNGRLLLRWSFSRKEGMAGVLRLRDTVQAIES
jgi:hypothetical protein